jgi:hypothetical protein
MTPRQALNILVWVVLLPITIGIWAQFLPPCAFGCVPKNQERLPPPQQPLKRYTVCGFGGPCWQVVGVPVRYFDRSVRTVIDPG